MTASKLINKKKERQMKRSILSLSLLLSNVVVLSAFLLYSNSLKAANDGKWKQVSFSCYGPCPDGSTASATGLDCPAGNETQCKEADCIVNCGGGGGQ